MKFDVTATFRSKHVMHKRNFHIISLNFNNLKSSTSYNVYQYCMNIEQRIHTRHCHTLHSIYYWWWKEKKRFFMLVFIRCCLSTTILYLQYSHSSPFQSHFSIYLNLRYFSARIIGSSMFVACSGAILSYNICKITGNATIELNQVRLRKWVFLLNFT